LRTVPLLAVAEEELARAAVHYEDQAVGLGEEFLQEFEHALERIAAFPSHGSPYLVGTRRVAMRRFPFHIVYLGEAEALLVVAVAHQRRRPGYWCKRV
jgi:plasmid stabilization system protein ParE